MKNPSKQPIKLSYEGICKYWDKHMGCIADGIGYLEADEMYVRVQGSSSAPKKCPYKDGFPLFK